MPSRKRSEARKEQILKAAEKVFAKKGFHEATISEVAREAGLSDATIYEYFSTKEELLFSIPRETTRRGMERMKGYLKFIRGAGNKIHTIIYHYLLFYQNAPDYASVVMLVLKSNRKFLETEAYQIIREGFRGILSVIEEGIDSGEFRPDTDPYLVRQMILGVIEHIVIRWLLLGKPKDILQYADPITDMIIDGIQNRNQTQGWNLHIKLEPQEDIRGKATPYTSRARRKHAPRKKK
ncbi:MAG: TetR/AcrR family transcriptional regulator [Desulfobacteraceae bacterium]|nr:TetR/AcrR family transcriptional regulator [Desulfobacteraceae bacterium]